MNHRLINAQEVQILLLNCFKALCHDDYNGMHRLSGTYRATFEQDLLANIPARYFSLKVVDSFGSEDGTLLL